MVNSSTKKRKQSKKVEEEQQQQKVTKKDVAASDSDDDNDGEQTKAADLKRQKKMEKKTAEVERSVYVEGLPFKATEEDVREWFSSTHNITSIQELRLPKFLDSGRLRGYGHVVLSDVDEVAAVLKLSGKKFTDTERYVTLAMAKKPKN